MAAILDTPEERPEIYEQESVGNTATIKALVKDVRWPGKHGYQHLLFKAALM